MSGRRPFGAGKAKGAPWRSAAFLVESMLLLVFLAVAMAVFVQVFGLSLARADEGEDLSRAIAAASGAAERFAADPADSGGSYEVDGLRVVCEVQGQPRGHGVLYQATVTVYDPAGTARSGEQPQPVYSVQAARYVGEAA